MVYSWEQRQESIIKEAEKDKKLNIVEKIDLLTQQNGARKRVLNELMEEWLEKRYTKESLLNHLGLSPNLPQTGRDVLRFKAWMEYVRLLANKNNSRIKENLRAKNVRYKKAMFESLIHGNRYTLDQLGKFSEELKQLNFDRDKKLAKDLAKWCKEKKEKMKGPGKTASTSLDAQGKLKQNKRKRDT
ncbi:hypothetical protein DD238_005555 [Peronospora effusa]|uniref:Uncharacterized protein n=1 Tax=Peronospora effusa TaxID=542832 RepID=A0A3M6VFW1_9STRA|nr:hypothetical protein DD238_005555 [Peronospora effusa]